MYKFLICLTIALSSITLTFGQSSERENRAVYNQIEYFFNSKQVDSIYHLAADSFKRQIPLAQLNGLFQQLFTLGRINTAELISFDTGIASYKVSLNTENLLFILGVDSTLKYNTLAIQPYKEPKIQKEEIVQSKVEIINPLDASVDIIARDYIQQAQTEGLAIAVIHQNKINKYFYGETKDSNKTLPNAQTIFEIGSITKTFTATLLSDLVEKQIINLDDSIVKFLPDSVAQNVALQKITFQSLANHTSGLPRLPDNLMSTPGFDSTNPYAHYNRAMLFSVLKDLKIDQDTETAYNYSNLGYGLLGELIAIISNKTYEECLKEIIFTPLHMNSTAMKLKPTDQNIAYPYHAGKEVKMWDFQSLAATGGLKSTLDDMLRFAVTQLSMPETKLQEAMANTKLFTFFIPPNTDIGLAWHTNMFEGLTSYWHNGGTGGSRSFIGLIPDTKSAVIVLSNSTIEVDSIAQKIIQELISTK